MPGVLSTCFEGKRTFRARRVIMAAPQTPSNMAVFNLDQRESSAFADVLTRPFFYQFFNVGQGKQLSQSPFDFWNINFSVPIDPPSSGILNQPFYNAPPTIANVFRSLPYGPVLVNSWAEDPISKNEMHQVILDQLGRIPSNLADFTTAADIVYHVYNPYFPAEALRRTPNPYTILERLQGYRKTYYLGALLNYAESAKVWEHAYRVVNEYF